MLMLTFMKLLKEEYVFPCHVLRRTIIHYVLCNYFDVVLPVFDYRHGVIEVVVLNSVAFAILVYASSVLVVQDSKTMRDRLQHMICTCRVLRRREIAVAVGDRKSVV